MTFHVKRTLVSQINIEGCSGDYVRLQGCNTQSIEMSLNNIVMAGLPKSGKTTFLAALWHLVHADEVHTALRFHSLKKGDYSHLNTIAKRWRDAEPQIRTDLRLPKFVQMNLVDSTGHEIELSFPDLSGEAYRIMWEMRKCTSDVNSTLQEGGSLLLFVHANRIKRPLWITEERQQMETLGLEVADEGRQELSWQPSISPTQVTLVDIIQLMQGAPLDYTPAKIAIGLSAWDTVAEEGRRPDEFLRTELPLLSQYLLSFFGPDRFRVYGVSAQGDEIEEMTAPLRPKAAALRAKDVPSERIIMVDQHGNRSNDLTEFLAWFVC